MNQRSMGPEKALVVIQGPSGDLLWAVVNVIRVELERREDYSDADFYAQDSPTVPDTSSLLHLTGVVVAGEWQQGPMPENWMSQPLALPEPAMALPRVEVRRLPPS